MGPTRSRLIAVTLALILRLVVDVLTRIVSDIGHPTRHARQLLTALRRRLAGTASVVPNAATERWLREDERGQAWIRALRRSTAPALSHLPEAVIQRATRSQRPGMPLLGPAAPTIDDLTSLVDAGPLYAGACVARIRDLRPAAEIVRTLAGARAGA